MITPKQNTPFLLINCKWWTVDFIAIVCQAKAEIIDVPVEVNCQQLRLKIGGVI
jgi:hypothetical protein